ncbi:hypothetical protein [Streptomyces sp. H27-C3]|uniref:hypothetical protein n=1 Tax=Streptomyces sp. H27-C3 TaxID=3046305 RepID=UPI0024BB8834|nr:hypothetical protein [Streptomyces sp. H27-C3]MDJ0461036.1 hypothetical protein [Streptomyces sp. H27-C3]
MDGQPVTVYPPEPDGGRRVVVGGEPLGRAHRVEDVVEFLRRAGLDQIEVEETDLIDWRGVGPEQWATPAD